MLIWLLALALGSAFAYLQYRLGDASYAKIPLALRGLAISIILALLLDAPGGPSRRVRPYAALDASSSWLSFGDTAIWRRAVRSADSVGANTLLLLGDSRLAASAPQNPTDRATRVAPLVERALGTGRAAVFVTDGRIDDPNDSPTFPVAR